MGHAPFSGTPESQDGDTVNESVSVMSHKQKKSNRDMRLLFYTGTTLPLPP